MVSRQMGSTDNNVKIQEKKEMQQAADTHGNWQIRPYTPAPVRICTSNIYRSNEIRPWVPEDDEDDDPPASQKNQTVNTLAMLLTLHCLKKDDPPASRNTQNMNTPAMLLDAVLSAMHSVDIMLG